MSRGGAREGTGPKKGIKYIRADQLRAALESAEHGLGIPYEIFLANTLKDLYKHFKREAFVKEFLMFVEQMNKRLVETPVFEARVSTDSGMTREEITERIKQSLATLATPTNDKD